MDERYSIELEFCGKTEPQWVVRFTGVWIASAPLREEAESIMAEHASRRAVGAEQ
jgi:hypothetical protein